MSLRVDPALTEKLKPAMNDPVPQTEFVNLLTEFPDRILYYYAVDKTANGLCMASSWLADEGIVSTNDAKALKKKRSFLSRIFK